MAQLDVAMGGRVAEEIIYGADEVTTGAGSDMQKATQLARQFVTQFSMSNLGLTTYDRNMPPSPETQATIDKEVKRLLDVRASCTSADLRSAARLPRRSRSSRRPHVPQESYARASKLLTQHRTELDRLANALVKHETLTLEEMKVAILGRSLPTEEQKQAERAASHKKKLEVRRCSLIVPVAARTSPVVCMLSRAAQEATLGWRLVRLGVGVIVQAAEEGGRGDA